jgi:hypothetical protein
MAGYDANTKLLIHLDAADGATTYTAETGQAVTFVGTAQTDTAQKKFGASSLLLDGNSDYITVPDSADWDIFANTSDNWTVDCWVRHTDHVGSEVYFSQYEDANNYWYFGHIHGTGLVLVVRNGGTNIIVMNTAGTEIADSNWHHVAMIKVGSEYGCYLDGTQRQYTSDTSTDTFAGALTIGTLSTNYFDGHIDEIRVQKSNYFNAAPNVGKTNTITVPTEAYSADATTGFMTTNKGWW